MQARKRERVHPQDAPAGAGGGWAGANIRAPAGRAPSLIRYKAFRFCYFASEGRRLFVPTKIKPCIATFAMLATLREGRPLPYGDKAKNGCRGGVPPPVRVIFVSPRTSRVEGKNRKDGALERINYNPL